jgi:hypothetical protein
VNRTREHNFRRCGLPAAALTLAVAVPLTLVAEPAVASEACAALRETSPRSLSLHASLTAAARTLCAQPAVAIIHDGPALIESAGPPAVQPTPADESPPFDNPPGLLVMDLPPPAC